MSSTRVLPIALFLLLACAVTTNQACQTASLADTDELTEGPYWIDPELNRSNTTEGYQGTPYTLTLRVWNKTAIAAACAGTDTDQPIIDGVGTLKGVQVDIWHANAAGHYSGFSAEGTAGLTFLRGYQLTNSSGHVTFQTIFPGWYTSRTTHIHIRIRLFNTDGTQTYDDTTQLFFSDTDSDAIYSANSLYNHGTRTTYNSNDNLYQSVMQLSVTGSATTAYQTVFDLYYPFVTATSSSTTSTTTTTTSTTTPTATPTPTTAARGTPPSRPAGPGA